MRIIVFILSLLVTACSMFDTENIPATSVAEVAAPETTILKQSTSETTNARVAYISEANGHLFLCGVAVDNRLTNCQVTGQTTSGNSPNWMPDSITFHAIGGINYAYVASTSSMFKCNVNPDNKLTNCINTGTDINQKHITWLPTDIDFSSESNTANAYVTAVKSVYQCSVAKNGDLVNCVTTGYGVSHQNMIWVANSITFHPLESANYAYIADATRLYQCEVGLNKDLINCHPTGTDSTSSRIKWHPHSISFSRDAGGYYAYVSDPSKMYECNVDTNGGIKNCNASGLYKNDSHWLPNDIVFNQVGNIKYAYVVGVYGAFVCTVGKYGALTNCMDTGFAPDGSRLKWNPNNIKLL
jgi:hypothetical protein